MKKMDEMDRNIQLRSEEFGYRAVMLLLCIWTLYNSWQTLAYGATFKPLPCFIVCIAACVQSFSQMAMKRKMTAGDEEYQQPNKLLWTIIGIIVVASILISVGTWLLIRR